jgi:predicted alpha/beta hydrolase family esterase
MKVMILPGYSLNNKQWAYEVAEKLEPGFVSIVHEWDHWSKGSFALKQEINKILEEIGSEKVNIIAKSIGTKVAMHLIPNVINKLNKVILCGIPIKFENGSVRALYKDGLLKLGDNVICFQNTADPFSPFNTIKDFIQTVNPNIPVIEKPRNDHEYPYFDDFKSFLS